MVALKLSFLIRIRLVLNVNHHYCRPALIVTCGVLFFFDNILWSTLTSPTTCVRASGHSAGSNYMPLLAVPCGHLVQAQIIVSVLLKSGAWRAHDHLASCIGQHATPNYGRSDQPDGWRWRASPPCIIGKMKQATATYMNESHPS